MMGTSVFYSSGDNGVAGENTNLTNPGCLNSKRMSPLKCYLALYWHSLYEDKEDITGTIFNPSFPVRADLGFFHFQWRIILLQSTCPYVTSVGATRMKPGSTVDDPEVAAIATAPNKTSFFSGGGFSNIFPWDCYYYFEYSDSDIDTPIQ